MTVVMIDVATSHEDLQITTQSEAASLTSARGLTATAAMAADTRSPRMDSVTTREAASARGQSIASTVALVEVAGEEEAVETSVEEEEVEVATEEDALWAAVVVGVRPNPSRILTRSR